ncbi:MAG: M6 family metalloprotease domain-containing protein, partial [Chloroflexota bacterium]
ITQPYGSLLQLFASGDEFYNWLEDQNYYTVIQDQTSGYYTYAQISDGNLVASPYVVGKVDPREAGLKPMLNISAEQREIIRKQSPLNTYQEMSASGGISNAPTTGSFTNLVVFIRFAGEAEFTSPPSRYTSMLTDTTPGVKSFINYFSEVSYGKLTINSLFVPSMAGGSVISYQDSHPRGYFQPYIAATNPIGYQGGDAGDERRDREFQLLRDAITANLASFPAGSVIDADGDGYIDEISFVISGSPTGWSSILWPHAWSMWINPSVINGRMLGRYNFELDGALDAKVLEHETFHVLGSPDLYHYSYDGLTPVGSWDLMESGSGHMGCYMKFKYGHWIDEIPSISTPGVYTLNPLTSSINNCMKIASPNSSSEFFVFEYRRNTGDFESALPGSGLLVYRINSAVYGNADGPPDEVYIYRPGGTVSANGAPGNAFFSRQSGRMVINDSTNPSSFLTSGGPGGLNLCKVGLAGATISFEICGANMLTISGSLGVEGALISYLRNGKLETVPSSASGTYSLYVPTGWSGTVIPSKPGYTFNPASRDFNAIASAQTGQDFSPLAPTNLILDPGLDAPTGIWNADPEYILCMLGSCTVYPNVLMPRSGSGWIILAWGEHASSAWQTLNIPSGSRAELNFYLLTAAWPDALASDQLHVKIDNDLLFTTGPGLGTQFSYYPVSIDVSQYADGQSHTLTFEASNLGDWIYYNIDDISLSVLQGANISGTSGQPGVTLSYVNEDESSQVSGAGGAFSIPLYQGWAGFIVPELSGYTFSPDFMSYTNLLADRTGETFLAIPNPTATFTPVPPTETNTFTPVPPTETNTFTPVPPTATNTFTPVPPTATNTFTPVPPTATKTATMTATRTPTKVVIKTATRTPTKVVIKTATKTPTKVVIKTATKTATPVAMINLLKDPGFELYPNNVNWGQTSTNSGTPLCNIADCGSFASAKPRTGKAWAWLGGVTAPSEIATLSQSVIIPSGTAKLDFYFMVGSVAAGSDAKDVFTVTVDGKIVWSANATQLATYNAYKLITIDLSAYANGLSHKISFNCSISGQNVTFNLDDVNLHK